MGLLSNNLSDLVQLNLYLQLKLWVWPTVVKAEDADDICNQLSSTKYVLRFINIYVERFVHQFKFYDQQWWLVDRNHMQWKFLCLLCFRINTSCATRLYRSFWTHLASTQISMMSDVLRFLLVNGHLDKFCFGVFHQLPNTCIFRLFSRVKNCYL